MKSAMPYLGVPTPLRAVCRELFAELASRRRAAAWQRDVLALWRGARYREERYAAIELTAPPLRAVPGRSTRCRCTRR